MVFTGRDTLYECTACRGRFHNFFPTSLLPMAAVIALTAWPWSRVLLHLIHTDWLAFTIAIPASALSLWLIYFAVIWLSTRRLRRLICPQCGKNLEFVGRGFHGGFIPNRWEVLIYLLAILVAFGLSALAHSIRRP